MRALMMPAAVLLLAAAAACSEGAARTGTTRDAAPAAASLGVVDSALSIEESLRRFRQGLKEPRGLRGTARSREALVRELVQALEARDTAAMQRMALAADEFAWLYYPSSPFSRPPYELPPELMWFQIQGQSERGARRLLAQRSGTALGYLDHECKAARTEGENRIYGPCTVRRVSAEGDTVSERLFGLILERGGRYRFVTYANDLD